MLYAFSALSIILYNNNPQQQLLHLSKFLQTGNKLPIDNLHKSQMDKIIDIERYGKDFTRLETVVRRCACSFEKRPIKHLRVVTGVGQ
jgi:hypothetical protein